MQKKPESTGGKREDVVDMGVLGDYLLIVASAVLAGLGTGNGFIGASVALGLIALYKPNR